MRHICKLRNKGSNVKPEEFLHDQHIQTKHRTLLTWHVNMLYNVNMIIKPQINQRNRNRLIFSELFPKGAKALKTHHLFVLMFDCIVSIFVSYITHKSQLNELCEWCERHVRPLIPALKYLWSLRAEEGVTLRFSWFKCLSSCAGIRWYEGLGGRAPWYHTTLRQSTEISFIILLWMDPVCGPVEKKLFLASSHSSGLQLLSAQLCGS